MPKWVEDQTEWKFQVPNQALETKVLVSGVMDETESERPKIFLRDDATNQGPSVMSEAGAAEGVKSLSSSMNIQPGEADWFAQDRNGQMYSIGLTSELKTVEDPRYTALKTSNAELPEDLEKAKRAFPDIQAEQLQVKLNEVKPAQQQEISDCYQEARGESEIEKSVAREPAPKSAHEYDLSQEHF